MTGSHFQLKNLTCPDRNSSVMSSSFDDNKKRAYTGRRSVLDYGMGLIIAGFGVFFAIAPFIGFTLDLEPLFRYMFAGLCLLYGTFRFYRGYKKNYFNE